MQILAEMTFKQNLNRVCFTNCNLKTVYLSKTYKSVPCKKFAFASLWKVFELPAVCVCENDSKTSNK